jgi:hypothetical protein
MWSFVGKKQRNVKRHETPVKGDQYRLCRYGWNAEGIVGWRVGKRSDTTLEFLHDLRQHVIGQPEISTDGFLPYCLWRQRLAWRDRKNVFGNAPCKRSAGPVLPVVAVSKEVVTGDLDQYISTS